ncbi:hypothetical protein PS6_011703, partial [Mucor atramentarius]
NARIIDDIENFTDVDDDGKKRLNEEKLLLQKYGQHTQQNEAILDASMHLSSQLSSQVPLYEDEDIDYNFQFNESSSSDENDEMQEKITIKIINTEEDDDEDIDTEMMEVFFFYLMVQMKCPQLQTASLRVSSSPKCITEASYTR